VVGVKAEEVNRLWCGMQRLSACGADWCKTWKSYSQRTG